MPLTLSCTVKRQSFVNFAAKSATTTKNLVTTEQRFYKFLYKLK